jgi:hypothetical protein
MWRCPKIDQLLDNGFAQRYRQANDGPSLATGQSTQRPPFLTQQTTPSFSPTQMTSLITSPPSMLSRPGWSLVEVEDKERERSRAERKAVV